jgi:Rrf2 family nitric oxide-sensitive transcriptional repressor
VRTVKGKGGGVELASSPENIRLDSVICAMEGPIHLMECTINEDACPLSSKCSLSRKIKEAQDSMIRVFSQTTIADLLVENPDSENNSFD